MSRVGPPPLPRVQPLDGAREDSAWPGGPMGRVWARAHGCLARPRCSSWRPGSHCESSDGALVMPQDTCPLPPSSVEGLLLTRSLAFHLPKEPPCWPPAPGSSPPRPRMVTTPFSPNLLWVSMRFKVLQGRPPHRSLGACSWPSLPCPSPQPRQPNFKPARLSRAPPPTSGHAASSLLSTGSQLRRPLLTGPSSAQLYLTPQHRSDADI